MESKKQTCFNIRITNNTPFCRFLEVVIDFSIKIDRETNLQTTNKPTTNGLDVAELLDLCISYIKIGIGYLFTAQGWIWISFFGFFRNGFRSCPGTIRTPGFLDWNANN